MKLKINILFLIVFSFHAVLAQDSFSSKLTENMKKDITSLSNHMKANSAPSVLAKDLDNLLYHMIPQKGLKTEEILQIGYKLQKHSEYYDLQAACRLALAFMNKKQNAIEKYQDLLDGMEFHIQSKLNERPSVFQDFICALAKYYYLIPNKADGVTEFGLNAPTTAMKSNIVKDFLFIRSEMRRIEKAGIKPSNYALANELLILVLKNIYQGKIAVPKSLNAEFLTKENRLMSNKLDVYIHKWLELQFPAQYILNPIKGTDMKSPILEERNKKKRYANIRELSIQGYGPASYRVGYDFEIAYGRDEKPQEAFKYYKLASKQGSIAGTIRLANCLVFGYGCTADPQKAYELLQPLTRDADFAKNGAYAYAVLLEKGLGGKADILDIMEYYTMAAEKGLKYSESESASKRIRQLYEKYYK